ncbi:unnamed protein product [Wuchereria bancrofti]|nr:unnamed protein product [Wuchereria bancrofti]
MSDFGAMTTRFSTIWQIRLFYSRKISEIKIEMKFAQILRANLLPIIVRRERWNDIQKRKTLNPSNFENLSIDDEFQFSSN